MENVRFSLEMLRMCHFTSTYCRKVFRTTIGFTELKNLDLGLQGYSNDDWIWFPNIAVSLTNAPIDSRLTPYLTIDTKFIVYIT